MNYLLDTNHWSYLQRRHPSVLARLESLPPDATVYMPVIAQAELLVGVELTADGRRKRELRALYETAIRENTDVLHVTSEVAGQFAAIFTRLRRKGRPIETNDIWIAATALARNLTLVSSDTHFHHVDGLRLEDWTKADAASQ